MKMVGAPNETYVVARTALLDALEGLGPHRAAVVLVGAQAIYMHTGAASLAVPEFTSDGDIALDPLLVPDSPDLSAAMMNKGFFRDDTGSGPDIGIWSSLRVINGAKTIVSVDLLMPEAVAGEGSRTAQVGSHQRGSVRRVHGLEGCLVDRSVATIASFDPVDSRSFDIMVAGPAALLVAKCIKLSERISEYESGKGDRRENKDALDVLRILSSIDHAVLSSQLRVLAEDELSGYVTLEALSAMKALFETAVSPASVMAADAAYPESPDTIAASCVTLTAELLKRYAGR